MEIEITKDVAWDLLKGVKAGYALFNHPLIEGKFDYSDCYGRFDWHSNVKELPIETIMEMYYLCKSQN